MAVEIKLNFASELDKVKDAFGLGPDAAKPRQVWFAEVRDGLEGPSALPLLARGIILRFRAKKKSGDATLKLRGPDGGIDPAGWAEHTRDVPAKLKKIEGDWAGERRQISASLDSDLDEAAVAVLKGAGPSVADLLSDAQRRLAAELMVPLARLTLLPPIDAVKWDANGDGVEAELWDVGTLRFLEISVRVDDGDAPAAMDRLLRRAKDGNLSLDGLADTKTTTVLRYLAGRR